MKERKAAGQMRAFYLVLAGVAVVALGAIIWQSRKQPAGAMQYVDTVQPGTAEGYLLGNPDAPVTIIEFADFQCPACGQWATVQEPDVRQRLIETGQANLRFFDFPLSIHQNTTQAHNAAACAADQGKFWEMHDRLFAGQPEWSESRNPKSSFERYAQALGLDMAKWNGCYDNATFLPRILANKQEGERRGVNSTPTFIIGKRMVARVLPADAVKALVDSAAAEAAAAGPTAARADSAR